MVSLHLRVLCLYAFTERCAPYFLFPFGGLLDNAAIDDMRKIAYAEARSWREEPTKSKYLGGAGERLVKQLLSLYPITYSDEMRIPGGDVTSTL